MAGTEAPPKALLADAFARGRAEGRALLMPFLVCAYPDADTFVAVAEAAAGAGADALEVGIPFSDPIMDGPIIQQATTQVLASGLRVVEAIELIGRAAERSGLPVTAMTYYNLPFHAGIEKFARACADAGIAGAILPDLTVEEAGPWREACAAAGVAPVFLAAPTSTPDRIRLIGAASEGFVYAASTLGVTGVRDEMSRRARDLVRAIRAATDTPVAVGIGVSTPEHAREVASYADGVIVGSALVKRIAAASDPAAETGSFVTQLRKGIAG